MGKRLNLRKGVLVADSTYFVKILDPYTVAFYHDSSLTIPAIINFAEFSNNTNLNVIPVGTEDNFLNYAYSTTSVGSLGITLETTWLNNYIDAKTIIWIDENKQPVTWTNTI